jgi:hypothetical protein
MRNSKQCKSRLCYLTIKSSSLNAAQNEQCLHFRPDLRKIMTFVAILCCTRLLFLKRYARAHDVYQSVIMKDVAMTYLYMISKDTYR